MQVHPRVAAILIGGGGKPLRELEQETGKVFHFQGSEGIPLDTFRITAEGTRDEIEERALPFKQGEEVLIRIEEPHMYNIDDAIAKIDGYVISVAGGGPFVGESKLIKIDEVKRTAAYASIVTGNGVPETPPRRAQAGPARAKPRPRGAEPPRPRWPRRRRRATPEEDGGKLQSNGSTSRRRRGRRGGRRRSGARGEFQRLRQFQRANDLRDHRNGRQAVPRGGGRLDPRRPRRRGRGREGLAPRAAVRGRQERGDGRAPTSARSRSRPS